MRKFSLCLLLMIVLNLVAFSADVSHSDIVFRNRLDEFYTLKNRFELVKLEMDKINIPKEGYAISAQMHRFLERQFLTFLVVQEKLQSNWESYVNFKQRGLPRDYTFYDRARQSEFSLKLTGIGVLSRITQFENSLYFIEKLKDNKILLNKFNEVSATVGTDYKKMIKELKQLEQDRSYSDIYDEVNSNDNRESLLKACNDFLNIARSTYSTRGINEDDDTVQYLITSIEKSTFISKISNSSWVERFLSWFDSIFVSSWEKVVKSYASFKYSISKFFGNTVGALKSSRKPYLNNDEMTDIIYTYLKPGDVLLEKTGFLLTDKFIPGHFGHAAIYSGKPSDILVGFSSDTANLFEKKANVLARKEGEPVSEYYEKDVLEALRPGVTINKLHHFLYVDDMAVLRLKDRYNGKPLNTPELIQKEIRKGFSYLGTDYDFAFDVNTSAQIVCSEMPYQCIPQIPFRTKEAMGSMSISPDDVAVAAGSEDRRPFELVLFVHKGKIVKEDAEKKYIDILNEEGSQYNEFPTYNQRADYSDYQW